MAITRISQGLSTVLGRYTLSWTPASAATAAWSQYGSAWNATYPFCNQHGFHSRCMLRLHVGFEFEVTAKNRWAFTAWGRYTGANWRRNQRIERAFEADSVPKLSLLPMSRSTI